MDLVNIEEQIECKERGSKQTNNMSQSIDLFRKYLLTKSQNHNVGKTNKEEESEVLLLKKKPSPPPPLIPLTPPTLDLYSILSRPPSLLERDLLSGIRCESIQTRSSNGDEKSSKAQLTIFYAGVINVYENVPTDKAQAIMLLAGDSSFSKPIANEKPKQETKKPLQHPNLESSCKLLQAQTQTQFTQTQAGLPVARKVSLQHFLAKRRRRIVANSPYATAANYKDIVKGKDINEPILLDNTNSNRNNHSNNISLSPFPSRLGYFLPVPPNKR